MSTRGICLAAVVLFSGGSGLAAAPVNAPPGAASCSGCHPAKKSADTPVPRLVGRDAGAIVSAMQAFKTGEMSATVMDRIAKGFTNDEIKAIADWYAAQKD